MGGWQLEVGKMALYMAFPVGMFHWFNTPEYFEKWVETKQPVESRNFSSFSS
jgi:protein PET100